MPSSPRPGDRTVGAAVAAGEDDGEHGDEDRGEDGTENGHGTATAGLMAGFPTDVIPLLPGATVTASAVRTSGDRLEVSLSGTSTKSADAILAFYDKTFRKQGFESTDGRTLAPGTGGRIYARGDEVLLVAVEGAGARRSFSVGGTVQR
ncbi:hypothetical protein [Kineosporia sp. A_224]|uniref:hypothetical protein n=1 Tax=Kineosporia sp. A_224 TaxID=1962180 RepID=UPI000B4B0C0C|nr:hypothetical protein [Kineosporia sp. A_224]